MNPAGLQLLLVATVLATIGLSIWIAIRVVRRKRCRAQISTLVAMLALYVVAWLGAALYSSPVVLATGDTKCFDDWCATLDGSRPLADHGIELAVRLSNAGGRPQKSNLARAFIEDAGTRLWPRDAAVLQSVVPANGRLDIKLAFDAPAEIARARFVISEGDSGSFTPAWLVIDDEASPWHARVTWSLAQP